jgi:K+-transporting ATPase KdpF subunit
MNVDWTTILAAVMAAVLVVYLTVALLKPEIFS